MTRSTYVFRSGGVDPSSCCAPCRSNELPLERKYEAGFRTQVSSRPCECYFLTLVKPRSVLIRFKSYYSTALLVCLCCINTSVRPGP